MKKLIILLLTIFTCVNCSSDDTKEILKIPTKATLEKLKGTWYSTPIQNKDNKTVRWILNFKGDRMDKYYQVKEKDTWVSLEDKAFIPYNVVLENNTIKGKVINTGGKMSIFVTLGLSTKTRELLEQRKKQHDIATITNMDKDTLQMILLEDIQESIILYKKESIDMINVFDPNQ